LMSPFAFAVKGDTEVIALRPISVGNGEANFAILLHATQRLQGRQKLAVALRQVAQSDAGQQSKPSWVSALLDKSVDDGVVVTPSKTVKKHSSVAAFADRQRRLAVGMGRAQR